MSAGVEERAIRLVRPLKDVGVKECGMYAWWRGLKVLGKDKWPGGRQSIAGLTKGTLIEDMRIRASFAHKSNFRIYNGIGEGLPFYGVNNHTDLCQVGAEG